MHQGDKAQATDKITAAVLKNSQFEDNLKPHGVYVFRCYDADGNLKWEDTIDNLITTVGKNHMLDTELAGSAYTAAWYLGLISNVSYTTGPAAADTMASHGGWTEAGGTNAPAYSQGTRVAPSFNAASGGVKATSAAVSFSISSGSSVIVKGAFLNSVSTKDGTTGTLLSVGLFSGGDKTVSSGDTLTSTYQLTLT